MRLAQIEWNEDPKNGKHLDRYINDGEFDKFHRHEHRPILVGLAKFSPPDIFGYEMIAAIPTGIFTGVDPRWHFGDGVYGTMQVGMTYINSNYIQLWLCDEQNVPRYHVASLNCNPESDLVRLCKLAMTRASEVACGESLWTYANRYICLQIREKALFIMEKNKRELEIMTQRMNDVHVIFNELSIIEE